MILSGKQILEELNRTIFIEPFEPKHVNPNSYDLTLYKDLMIYDTHVLDCKGDNPTTTIEIPADGYILQPGELYLARTNEFTRTYKHAPHLEGKSSLGRLGLHVHITAGFGDVGFEGYWTLELQVVKPLKIYPNMKICQVVYNEVLGDVEAYSGKYQNNSGIQSSQMYKNFKE